MGLVSARVSEHIGKAAVEYTRGRTQVTSHWVW
jgi:hypothetical protein